MFRFKVFLMVTVFSLSNPFTAAVDFWVTKMDPINALSRWWPFLCRNWASGLKELEKSHFLRCIQVLKEIGYFSFFFNALVKVAASILGMIVFISWSGFRWNVPVLHFYWNVCYWFSELIWPRKDWICSFFVGRFLVSSSSYLHGVTPAKEAQLRFTVDNKKSFRWLVFWGILMSFLNLPVHFSQKDFLKLIDELYKDHPTLLRMFVRLRAFFSCEWRWQSSLITSENRLLSFSFFSKFSLFWSFPQ